MKNSFSQFDPKKEYKDTLRELVFLQAEQDEFFITYRKALDEAKIEKLRTTFHGRNTTREF